MIELGMAKRRREIDHVRNSSTRGVEANKKKSKEEQ